MSNLSNVKRPQNATAVIVLSDGTVIWGHGTGAETKTVGEICFNTSMTGYQEVLTDPSYAGQIITFTFPHIGIVGTNAQDIESLSPAARGMISGQDITAPSNWRASQNLNQWLKENNIPGISGVDTRALTKAIRDNGAPNGVLCHDKSGNFDLDALHEEAKSWPGLEGMDLAKEVTCKKPYNWSQTLWNIKRGYGDQNDNPKKPKYKVVAIDYGAKLNILRCLASEDCEVVVVPANSSSADILAHNPDGVFLSNGPGDPQATGKYAVPVIRELLAKDMPIFGICLGHQLLSIALGAKTRKMHLGHRGANHPVKDIETGKVEITSQNHGFEIIEDSLPENVTPTHTSLFDGSNEGIRLKDKPVFSVQYHPEASPGPQDSHYLFKRFVDSFK